jgi:hypothetical protein
MAVSKSILCTACGAPAAYVWQREPGPVAENVCSECARFRGASDRGEARAAFDMLGFTVSLARGAGVSDDQLREVFDRLLTGKAPSIGTYDSDAGDGVLSPDFGDARPWQWSGSWAELIA